MAGCVTSDIERSLDGCENFCYFCVGQWSTCGTKETKIDQTKEGFKNEKNNGANSIDLNGHDRDSTGSDMGQSGEGR